MGAITLELRDIEIPHVYFECAIIGYFRRDVCSTYRVGK
ncbi:hypothetical protein BH09MYX1_BH09MYX1_19290 [soil metagenome]